MNRFILTLLAACAAASPVLAAPTCGSLGLIVDYLKEGWGEEEEGVGYFGGSSDLMVLFTNEETGTWSILRIDDFGNACIVSNGSGWAEWLPGSSI